MKIAIASVLIIAALAAVAVYANDRQQSAIIADRFDGKVWVTHPSFSAHPHEAVRVACREFGGGIVDFGGSVVAVSRTVFDLDCRNITLRHGVFEPRVDSRSDHIRSR